MLNSSVIDHYAGGTTSSNSRLRVVAMVDVVSMVGGLTMIGVVTLNGVVTMMV
jgi:hypothetical protein